MPVLVEGGWAAPTATAAAAAELLDATAVSNGGTDANEDPTASAAPCTACDDWLLPSRGVSPGWCTNVPRFSTGPRVFSSSSLEVPLLPSALLLLPPSCSALSDRGNSFAAIPPERVVCTAAAPPPLGLIVFAESSPPPLLLLLLLLLLIVPRLELRLPLLLLFADECKESAAAALLRDVESIVGSDMRR
jgi:hypothetical protein